MAQKDSFNLRKKDFPGLTRVTQGGERVWQYQGRFFKTKREVYLFQNPPRQKEVMTAPTLDEAPKTAPV